MEKKREKKLYFRGKSRYKIFFIIELEWVCKSRGYGGGGSLEWGGSRGRMG